MSQHNRRFIHLEYFAKCPFSSKLCVSLNILHAVQFFKPQGATFSAIVKILNAFPMSDKGQVLWLKLSSSLNLNEIEHFSMVSAYI